MTASLLYGQPLVDYLYAGAVKRGDDPKAVVADAVREGGLYGKAGDSGSSFGPFQLHVGGELPPSISVANARTWANSPTGLDYALDGIDKVAHGLVGQAAIAAIVTKFERPADPAKEIADEVALYGKNPPSAPLLSSLQQQGSGFLGGAPSPTGIPGLPGPAIPGLPGTGIPSTSSWLDVFKLFRKVLDLFADPVRLLEVLGGLVLLVLGIVTLTRWLSRSQVVVQTKASGRALAGLAA